MLRIIGLIFGALMLAFAGWFFRPWSPFSPAEIIISREFSDQVVAARSMDEVFPHTVIEGAQSLYEFPEDQREIPKTYEWEGQQKPLAKFIDEATVTGLVVIKDGMLVHESYYRGETSESRHTSWSVAKSYVATLVGIALKEGKINSLDDTVEDYAPQFTGTDYGKITLRHLLMMSSGIDFIEDYSVRGSDIRSLFSNVFLFNQDVDLQVAQYQSNRAAGQDFDYISPNTHVLSAILRSIYNKPLAQIASEKLFQPMGMASGSWSQDRKGIAGKAIGYCCINTTLKDYAKFGQLYLQNGSWQGRQILPDSWAAFVRTPQTENHKPSSLDDERGRFGYGMHFWLPPGADGEFYAAGFDGQYVWIDVKNNVVIARTSADRNAIMRGTETVAVMRAIAKAM